MDHIFEGGVNHMFTGKLQKFDNILREEGTIENGGRGSIEG